MASAAAVFGEHGFHAATFAQIATRAEVSVETVRKHGPKTALRWAAVEVASFGVEGDVDLFDTERGRAFLATGDPDEFAALAGATMPAINEPVAGTWTAAAHGDPEVAGHLARRLATIRGQVEQALRVVGDRGWPRADVPFDDLVEAVCVLTSVETYVRFVRVDGRSPQRYQAFVARALRDTVLAR
ncbi:TetR/AcrR family transcriptional regulator [Actinophytocola sp. KF-1]